MKTTKTIIDPGIVKNNSVEAELPEGLHILAEFRDCRQELKEMTESNALESFCTNAMEKSGLTIVGKTFYQFPGAGVTGVVLLAESHMAIHTWPEKDYITIDIFVCNFETDNSGKARSLYVEFLNHFNPKSVNMQEAFRS